MAATTLDIERLTDTVGAEVHDVDRERLLNDDTVPSAVMDALEANGVLVFRGLHIDDESQMQFCRKLGEIATYPDQKIPGIFIITRDLKKNPSAAYLKASIYWHMDDTQRPIPSKATMLSAKELAEYGGETEFASTYAAYDLLTPEERERYAHLRVLHSQVPIQSMAYPNPTAGQIADWRTKSREHPLVWTHRTGRCSLVLGQTCDYVVGMDAEEGRALLDDLNERATAPERVYRHVWSEGDTIMWDNRGVLHRVLPFEENSRREAHRTTLVGDEPIQ